MNFCTNCGNIYDDKTILCLNCGVRFDTAPPPTKLPVPEQPISKPYSITNTHLLIILLSLCAALFVILFFMTIILRSDNSSKNIAEIKAETYSGQDETPINEEVTEIIDEPQLTNITDMADLTVIEKKESLYGVWDTLSGLRLYFFCSPTRIAFYPDGNVFITCCQKNALLEVHDDSSFTVSLDTGKFKFTYSVSDNILTITDHDGDSATFSKVTMDSR